MVAKTKKSKATRKKKTAGRRARGTSVTPEERYRMIAEAAYYRAEKDHFRSSPVAYWLAAEKEIDARF